MIFKLDTQKMISEPETRIKPATFLKTSNSYTKKSKANVGMFLSRGHQEKNIKQHCRNCQIVYTRKRF